MTPAEWTIAAQIAQLVLVPLAIAIWRLYRGKVKDEATRDFVDQIVLAAEELGAMGKVDDKRRWAAGKVAERFPKLGDGETNAMIHAAVARHGFGAREKTTAKRLAAATRYKP